MIERMESLYKKAKLAKMHISCFKLHPDDYKALNLKIYRKVAVKADERVPKGCVWMTFK